MKNVLITGGYGFLGQYITKAILDGFPQTHIKILDLKRPAHLLFDLESDPRVTGAFVDICREDEIQDEFVDIDVVVHLVGLISSSIRDKDRMFRVNVEGTENVLKAMLSHKVPRLIHISSVAALGYRMSGDEPIDEDFDFDWKIARRLKKYYMLTKHLADVKVVDYKKRGINAIILHPSLMYGPGDTTNSSRIIRALKARKIPFNMPGGTSVIHVRDVAEGVVAALKSETSNGRYLITGYNYPYQKINEIIAGVVGVSPPSKRLPRWLHMLLFRLFQVIEKMSLGKPELCADDIDNVFRFRYYDNSKARRTLGWRPQISFQQTVVETKEWMEKNGYLEG